MELSQKLELVITIVENVSQPLFILISLLQPRDIPSLFRQDEDYQKYETTGSDGG